MKKYLLIAGLAAFVSCTSTDKPSGVEKQGNIVDQEKEQDAKNAALKDTSNYTTIEWIDPVMKDLGSITEGQVVDLEYKFRNSGTKPLVIAKVAGGCGCTDTKGPDAPVAPGAEGVIHARFNSEGKSGLQNKDIYVTANNSNKNSESQDVLRFRVEVTQKN